MSYYGKIDGGFSFNGTPIAQYKLEYAPDISETYVWKPGENTIHSQVFDGHDGGYYYGKTRQPKVFNLKCFYEGQSITRGIMFKLLSDFKTGTKGRLIFDKRPWLYYDVVITKVDIDKGFNYLNGLAVISCTCFDGYGHTDLMYNPYAPTTVEYKSVVNNSYMLSQSEMNNYPTLINNITSTTTIKLWNPGNAKTKIKIKYTGTSSKGISIENTTTGDKCLMNKSSGTIMIDGTDGKTYTGTSANVLDFKYHYEGFIELDPMENTIRIAPRDGGTINLSSIEFMYNPAFD